MSAAIDEKLWKKITALVPVSGISRTKMPHYIGTIDEYRIYLVDGDKVMLHWDMDFVSANNCEEQPSFIPKDHIWLDDNVQPREQPFDLYHEIHEARLMRGGLSYNKAHSSANQVEKALRKRARGACGTCKREPCSCK